MEMRYMTSARAKVGALLLDVIQPDWFNKIDLDRLNLRDASACVLGQLFGEYKAGAERLFAIVKPTEISLRYIDGEVWYAGQAERAGFYVSINTLVGHDARKCYGKLIEAWKREIRKRRAANAPKVETA
jgi:hypothetical protein